MQEIHFRFKSLLTFSNDRDKVSLIRYLPGVRSMRDGTNSLPIRGVKAIAAARNEPEHVTYRGLALGYIAGFKIGGIWHWRPETQVAEYARLEAEARLAAEERRTRRNGSRRRVRNSSARKARG